MVINSQTPCMNPAQPPVTHLPLRTGPHNHHLDDGLSVCCQTQWDWFCDLYLIIIIWSNIKDTMYECRYTFIHRVNNHIYHYEWTRFGQKHHWSLHKVHKYDLHNQYPVPPTTQQEVRTSVFFHNLNNTLKIEKQTKKTVNCNYLIKWHEWNT